MKSLSRRHNVVQPSRGSCTCNPYTAHFSSRVSSTMQLEWDSSSPDMEIRWHFESPLGEARVVLPVACFAWRDLLFDGLGNVGAGVADPSTPGSVHTPTVSVLATRWSIPIHRVVPTPMVPGSPNGTVSGYFLSVALVVGACVDVCTGSGARTRWTGHEHVGASVHSGMRRRSSTSYVSCMYHSHNHSRSWYPHRIRTQTPVIPCARSGLESRTRSTRSAQEHFEGGRTRGAP